MKTVSSWQATYAPGRWVVLAGPTSVVIMQPAPARMSGLLNDLWLDVVSAADIGDLAQRLSAFRLDLMPHFAAFFWAADGMHSLVRGGLRAVDVETGEVVAQGEDFLTWNEVGLQHVRQVRVDMDEVEPDSVLQLPLAVGIVQAASVLIDSTRKVPLVLPSVVAGLAAAEPPAADETAEPAPAADETEAPAPAAEAPAEPPVADEVTEVLPAERGEDENSAAAPAPFETPPPAPVASAVPDESDAWGVRAAETAVPVPLFLDEDGDGIPDAQQPGLDLGPEEATEPVPVNLGPDSAMGLPTPDSSDSEGTVFSSAIAMTHKPVPPAPDLGPLILAVLCPAGHANPPGSVRCRVCGQRVDDANPRLLPKPTLAELVTVDGARVRLTGTVLVGRAPSAAADDGDAVLLAVPSPNSDISRTHLKITANDWDIVATDLHSTNGTMMMRPGQAPVRMMPGRPVTLEPGTILDLGDGGVLSVVLPA